jgi:hypothetical protein
MLASTFELLLKTQLPKEIEVAGAVVTLPTSPLNRAIVQGYFLTIANVTKSDVKLRLSFEAVTAVADLIDLTATILDKGGSNTVDDVIPTVANAYEFPIDLASDTTCLFILQPDVTKPELLANLGIELRGYVRINLAADSPSSIVRLLVTPEQRGTFFREGVDLDIPVSDRQLGEVAYSLPTASGGSLYTLSS